MKIEVISSDRFDEVFSIMQKSFPIDEMRPYREQKELLSNSKYKIFVAFEDGKIIAFAATWQFDDLLFLEHLATDPTMRGQGIGAKMLDFLTADKTKMICLEAEPPTSEITRRRIGFYNRNGFYLNEYPYIQPPISKGRSPVPLMIMTYGKKIDKSRFEQIRDRLYKEVYKTDKVNWSI